MSRTIQVQVHQPNGDTKMISQECSDSMETVIDAVNAVRTQTNSYLTHIIENIAKDNVASKDCGDDDDEMEDLDIEQVDGENKRKSTEMDDSESSKRVRQ